MSEDINKNNFSDEEFNSEIPDSDPVETQDTEEISDASADYVNDTDSDVFSSGSVDDVSDPVDGVSSDEDSPFEENETYYKSGALLEQEASDLLSELDTANGEEPADSYGPDSELFDAVVDDHGEIEGLLENSEETGSEKEEIPAVIAAASEKGPENMGDSTKTSKKSKRNRKSKTAESAAVSGEKISGSRTRKLRKRASFWQVLVRLFLILICIGILGGCALGVGVTMYIADVTSEDDKVLNLDNIKLSLATSLMVKNSETGEWEEFERIYSGENRVWIDYADIPECLVDALIASEDHGFKTHHGVDWKRTAFALINQIFHITDNVQGGSTITQQLIKNITNEKQVSGIDGILRKIREIYRALNMEKNFSKTQILEAYLNTFSLGGQVAGIESAAKYYFGKTTSDLTVEECCAIICITKAPTAYNPYNHPEENKKQRDYILYQMLELGLLTQTQYDAAKARSDEMVFDEANRESGSTSTVYSYFTDVVISEVYNDLMKYKNLSSEEAYDLLYQGGLKIYTTMDPKVQAACEAAAWDDDIWPDYKTDSEGNRLENQIEGAIVVMNYDGEVVGTAGGIREKTASLSLARGYTSTRQTGSAMKPLAVYAPGIELKKIHYSSLFPDVASERVNGRDWPRNFDSTYGTPVTVYKAVCKSLNTIAVLTMQLVGVDFSFDFLTSSLGLTTLVDNRWSDAQGKYLTDRTPSLALGGLTDGCTVTEICAAYCTFGNLGVYKAPRYYTIIEDSSGDIVLDKSKFASTNQAMSAQTAYIMNQIMQGVVREGTATAIRKGAKQATAGKTGTSSDNNDFWIVGLNPYYCCAGWMGYDMNGRMTPYSIHYDIQYAVRDVLNTISNDLPVISFERPDGVVTASFCMSSGDYSSAECTSKRTGYYTKDNMPSSTCIHSLYQNDGNGKTIEETTTGG